VARRAGVSKGAVSFALNGRPGVAEATRARILEIATELGWKPSTRARALSAQRAFAVGLVMARPARLIGADPFFAPFLAGVETVLATCEYALVLQVVTGGRHAEAASYRRLVEGGRVDGVFVLDPRRDDHRFALLGELELPAVVVGDVVGPCPLPAVGAGQPSGVTLAVQHLMELGHTHIAHVSGPPGLASTVLRRTAWREAMQQAGLPPGRVVVGDFTAAGGRRATQRLLTDTSPPTAIVYANDVMAIAGIAAAHDAGLRLPDDLAVVGHDDVMLAAHLTPALTTITQDVPALGAESARALLALVDGKEPAPAKLPEPALVVRSSTARPRPPH
jgi:DNA-binding LacI/PurR family transcriptional regulator